jgi:hypothetical protein
MTYLFSVHLLDCGAHRLRENIPLRSHINLATPQPYLTVSFTLILATISFILTLATASFTPQSTYKYRVPQCISPRRNCDPPNPSLASECAPPPRIGGGGGGTLCFTRSLAISHPELDHSLTLNLATPHPGLYSMPQ